MTLVAGWGDAPHLPPPSLPLPALCCQVTPPWSCEYAGRPWSWWWYNGWSLWRYQTITVLLSGLVLVANVHHALFTSLPLQQQLEHTTKLTPQVMMGRIMIILWRISQYSWSLQIIHPGVNNDLPWELCPLYWNRVSDLSDNSCSNCTVFHIAKAIRVLRW